MPPHQVMSDLKAGLLQRHARAILHLSSLLREESPRVTPIVGAGASMDLDFPSWDQLRSQLFKKLNRILEENGDRPGMLQESSDVTRDVQMAYEAHKVLVRKLYDDCIGAHHSSGDLNFNSFIDNQWHNLLRDVLYEKPMEKFLVLTRKQGIADYYSESHPYLAALVSIVIKCPITINYNFDDSLARVLKRQTNDEFQIVTNARLPLRPGAKVIYHPNGFVSNHYDQQNNSALILTRSSFEDQLLHIQQGMNPFLANRLLHSTGLFVGISLSDPTLRQQLHATSQISPGHCHYLLKFCASPAETTSRHATLEREANFIDYNTVTLHLTKEEYAPFFQLVTEPEESLKQDCEAAGLPTQQTYFITGSAGSGKTTTSAFLNGFTVIDEWADGANPLLYKTPSQLTEDERKNLDGWVLLQMVKKCQGIASKTGIYIMDRTPIDPLAYTNGIVEQRDKAKKFMETFDAARLTPLQGVVIILEGDTTTFALRHSCRKFVVSQGGAALASEYHRWKGEMELLLKNLRILFPAESSGVFYVNVQGKTREQVAKIVARIMHLAEYKPFDFSAALRKCAK